jgi:Domain of unknown function (DUF1931)
MSPILEQLTRLPRSTSPITPKLPGIVGGLSVALAHSFKIVNPDLKNPRTNH